MTYAEYRANLRQYRSYVDRDILPPKHIMDAVHNYEDSHGLDHWTEVMKQEAEERQLTLFEVQL